MARKIFKTNKALKTPKATTKAVSTYFEKLEGEIQNNQSKVSMILGALIILVVGILIFNFFNRSKPSLGPAQQTEANQDVLVNNLPGKYTVKDGDTLFQVAEKYYQDGSRFTDIAKTNNLWNADQIEAGQILEIPKLESQQAQASPEPSSSNEPQDTQALGTGGGNNTIWGDKIDGNSYTVIEGDWLSKIAGRAYGNIMAFDKIAKANNISNPDEIEPGIVLTIPR